MSIGDDAAYEDYVDAELLPPDESLDEDEVGADPDEGYSPAERPLELTAWGTTAAEESSYDSLTHLLAREEPDVSDAESGDGIGDTSDTDGEPIDREVGDMRAGRLVTGDLDVADPRSDYFALDIGIDGAAASAEEAAVHLVPDGDDAFGFDIID